LVRHFGHRFEFVVTKEKYLVNVDVHIDDRRSILSTFDDPTLLIQLDTPYIQSEVRDNRIIKATTWKNILEIINNSKLIKE
jgi:5'(3')-deoxyribonucleotidase